MSTPPRRLPPRLSSASASPGPLASSILAPQVLLGPSKAAISTSSVIVGCQLPQRLRLVAEAPPEDQRNSEHHRAWAKLLRIGVRSFECSSACDVDEELSLGDFLGSSDCSEAQYACGMSPQVHTAFVPANAEAPSDGAYVEASLRRSIRRLHLPQHRAIDLVQLHRRDFPHGGSAEAAHSLASFTSAAQSLGGEVPLVRGVGLVDFGVVPLSRILDAGVPVVSCQVRLSLLDRRACSGGFLEFCLRKRISVISSGATAGGLLSDRHLGQPVPSWLFGPQTAPTRLLAEHAILLRELGAGDAEAGWEQLQAVLLLLRSFADERSEHSGATVTIEQLAIAWALRQPGVVACVVQGCGEDDAATTGLEAVAAASLDLADEELVAITAALRNMGGRLRTSPDGDRLSELTSGELADASWALAAPGSSLGGDAHACEILEAWRSPTLRARGGLLFRHRLAWEARYCLEAGQLSAEVAELLNSGLRRIEGWQPQDVTAPSEATSLTSPGKQHEQQQQQQTPLAQPPQQPQSPPPQRSRAQQLESQLLLERQKGLGGSGRKLPFNRIRTPLLAAGRPQTPVLTGRTPWRPR